MSLWGPQRSVVGHHRRGVIRAFLEPDWRAIGHQLSGLGLTAKEIEQVVAECYPESEVSATIASRAAATIALFRRNGVLDDHRALDAFGKSGLCELTAHRFVQKFFLPTPHRLLASRPEPTFHPPEMSVQPASLGSGPSLPFAVLRRAWGVCLEEEPGYSGSPGGGDDRS